MELIRIDKPWGYYETLYIEETYLVKKIVVYPMQRISLQSHKYRVEHWAIVEGKGELRLETDIHSVVYNDTVTVPIGVKHRIENTDEEADLVFIETQIGYTVSEDDIIRYEDDYGRLE